VVNKKEDGIWAVPYKAASKVWGGLFFGMAQGPPLREGRPKAKRGLTAQGHKKREGARQQEEG